MADVKWIKLSVGLPDNRKLKQIRRLPEGDSIALMWVFLMCLAGETNEDGMVYFTPEIPYTEEMLADQFNMSVNVIRLGLTTFQKFGMIEIVNDIICLSSWEKWQATDSLETIREQTRKRVAKHREKQKLLASNVTCNVTVTECNATEEEQELEEDKEKDIINSATKVSKQDIESFFESIWKLYPNKKGKGQVSDSKKKTLYDIGYDEMARAIERYKTDLAKEDWRKPQNGSTFFNSGYVDYLDANYTPLVVQPQKPKNQFTNFDQRNYDYDALERMLVDNSVKVSSDPELQAEADALKKMLQETY